MVVEAHLREADGHSEEDHDEGVEGEDGLDVLHTLNHFKSGTLITGIDKKSSPVYFYLSELETNGATSIAVKLGETSSIILKKKTYIFKLSSPSPNPSPPRPNPNPKSKEVKNLKSYGTWGDTIITWATHPLTPPHL